MINIKEYVREEMKKYDGIYVPVRASLLEQIFVRNSSPKKLHPNPGDEFCHENVGPNDAVIAKYLKEITFHMEHSMELFDEPLMVEKIRPDGYMLLNGHHRWAASLMLDVEKVPVQVTNLTHESDIIGSMEKTDRTKRASINLDDVVFCRNDDEPAEKKLIFPFSRIFRERIRLGIPGLVYALHEAGYDVWFYTAGYVSSDYLKYMFRLYRIGVEGIINGYNRMDSSGRHGMSSVKELMAKKYRVTLNIDMDSVSWIRSDTKNFEMIDIPAKDETWAHEVITIVRKLKEL